jgi:DNA-binding transcriptional LysR family regulator
MTINQMRYFLAAATLGSLTRAAESFGVTQPTLTRQLDDLEAEVGAKLLDRSPRGVAPTALGREFLEDVRAILASIDASLARMRALSKAGSLQLRVGIEEQLSNWWPGFLSFFQSFSQENPALHLDPSHFDSLTGLDRNLRSHRLDALIGSRLDPEDSYLKALTLAEVGILCAGPEDWFPEPPESLDRILERPLVLSDPEHPNPACALVLAEIRRRHLKAEVARNARTLNERLLLVERGVGCTFVPEPMAWRWRLLAPQSRVRFLEVPDLEARLKLELVWRRGDRSEALRSLIGFLGPRLPLGRPLP